MIYKKYTIAEDKVRYIPLKSKKVLLPEVARAIAEINMSEIKAEEKIGPDELVHAVLDEMFTILAEKLWNNLPE
jgi:hypothetical protein